MIRLEDIVQTVTEAEDGTLRFTAKLTIETWFEHKNVHHGQTGFTPRSALDFLLLHIYGTDEDSAQVYTLDCSPMEYIERVRACLEGCSE